MTASAEAYLAWWRLAGVDSAIEDAPVSWLRPSPVRAPQTSESRPDAPKPSTLDAFHAWLGEDESQPERRWPGKPILPPVVANAPLMVIVDMPDAADMTSSALLSGPAGQLFDALLASIGLVRDRIYLASLFLSRPPGGMVEAADLATVTARMRTHVALAAPARLLVLGDRTIRTLIPDGASTGNGLHIFNHDGGTIAAYATFHPRLLLGQPAAKAECWRILQCLAEEMTK